MRQASPAITPRTMAFLVLVSIFVWAGLFTALVHQFGPVIVDRPWLSIVLAVLMVGVLAALVRLLGGPVTLQRPRAIVAGAVVLVLVMAGFAYAASLGPYSRLGHAISLTIIVILLGRSSYLMGLKRGRSEGLKVGPTSDGAEGTTPRTS